MTTQTELASPQTAGRSVSPWRRIHFIAPLICVNLLALIGQSLWTWHKLREVFLANHPVWALTFAVLMGLTLESIATYLSLQAHAALMADQDTGSLRLGAYGIGALMAALNFNHFFAAPIDSLALGVMFGLASLVSPWLWAVESRAAHRAQLVARGLSDPRGVELSSVRKRWHPIRSLRVMSWAAWAGEVDPKRAVEGWESATRSMPIADPVRAEVVIDSAAARTAGPAIESARTQSTDPVRGLLAVEAGSVDSATDSESVTETVTETVTRTRTQTWSVATERRIQTLRTRVEAVKAAYPDWQTNPLDYGAIGSVIERTGREVIKPIYGVLYQGQSIESALGLETVDGSVDRDKLTV